jgi:hypothetical protein
MSRTVLGMFPKITTLTAALALLAPTLTRAEGPSATTPPAATAPTAGQAQAAATPAHRTFPPVEAGPIAEDTTVQGKPATDLQGVWLLVVNIETAPGRPKTFPELFKVSAGKNGPVFNLLDVRLPDDVAQAINTANRTGHPWQPDDAALKTLRQNWSTLPPAKLKTLEEFLYAKIHYKVLAPDHYDQASKGSDATADRVLKDSKLALMIEEEYKPRDLGPDSRVAQLMARNSMYGVKQVDKDTLKGDGATGFIAAGSGMPLPFKFAAPFVMYRLSAN